MEEKRSFGIIPGTVRSAIQWIDSKKRLFKKKTSIDILNEIREAIEGTVKEIWLGVLKEK